jgi:hypothetical protein
LKYDALQRGRDGSAVYRVSDEEAEREERGADAGGKRHDETGKGRKESIANDAHTVTDDRRAISSVDWAGAG